MKITVRTAVGMGERSPLYGPGSKLYYRESKINARITLSRMGKVLEVKCITAAGIVRYLSKLHRSTRSGPTAVVLCNRFMYNFSNHTQRTWSVTLVAPDAWLSKPTIRNTLDTFRRQTKGPIGVCSDLSDRYFWSMKPGIGLTKKKVAIICSTLLSLLVYIELLALPYILYAQAMIVCGDFFYST